MLSQKNYNQFIISLDNDLEPLLKLQNILTKLDNFNKNFNYSLNRTYFNNLILFLSSYCDYISIISDYEITFNYLDILEITNYILANQEHYIQLQLPKIEGVND